MTINFAFVEDGFARAQTAFLQKASGGMDVDDVYNAAIRLTCSCLFGASFGYETQIVHMGLTGETSAAENFDLEGGLAPMPLETPDVEKKIAQAVLPDGCREGLAFIQKSTGARDDGLALRMALRFTQNLVSAMKATPDIAYIRLFEEKGARRIDRLHTPFDTTAGGDITRLVRQGAKALRAAFDKYAGKTEADAPEPLPPTKPIIKEVRPSAQKP